MSVIRILLLPAVFGSLLFISCSSSSSKQIDSAMAAARNGIYDRAHVEFANAVFYKPSEPALVPEAQLAPLFFQETSDSHSTEQQYFVRATKKSGGNKHLIAGIPTVYFSKEKVRLKNKEYDQTTFIWFHAIDEKISPQGVRITVDSNGQPAVWEIFNDSSGIQQIFVSQSLENSAASEFGSPLPGRRSALERAVSEAPQAIVSRVISDGPLAMGPAIYLSAKNNDVTTLLCRCMPPQAKRIISNHEYELLPLDSLEMKSSLKKTLGVQHGFIPVPGQELDNKLRLPKNF